MDKLLEILQHSQNTKNISKSLVTFCKANSQTMKFHILNNDNNIRYEIWKLLFEKLLDDEYSSIHEKCLETMRILSRDKSDLDNIVTDDRLDIIISKSNLAESSAFPENVSIEALKLICNLIYNSPSIQIQIVKTSCLSNLVKKISSYNESTPHDIKLFHMRILFLVTALNTTSRNILKYELNAHDQLINMLENLSNQMNQDNPKTKNIEVTCEILKTLFNLYIECDDFADAEIQKYNKIIDISYQLLNIKDFKRKMDLQNHVINLLTAMPSDCYNRIIKPATNIKKRKNQKIYNEMDMSAISELLKFLDHRLNNLTKTSENILPVLIVLLKFSKHERLIRKYCRQEVLPPLKDVMKRPEEGTTLKAKLCKLLVSPLIELKNVVAEFLFVLCKGNVGRMIKYTGYGNAAGMFADKGLLKCKQPQTDYSSDSGESDTEEYSKYKNDINPVTGCYEKPKPNPLEGMSEEQKEYEAMKLVNLVNQLANDGIVRPCKIGEDGKPKPVEHVLELQDSLQQKMKFDQNSDTE